MKKKKRMGKTGRRFQKYRTRNRVYSSRRSWGRNEEENHQNHRVLQGVFQWFAAKVPHLRRQVLCSLGICRLVSALPTQAEKRNALGQMSTPSSGLSRPFWSISFLIYRIAASFLAWGIFFSVPTRRGKQCSLSPTITVENVSVGSVEV
jgi:hypothetical protein